MGVCESICSHIPAVCVEFYCIVVASVVVEVYFAVAAVELTVVGFQYWSRTPSKRKVLAILESGQVRTDLPTPTEKLW